MLLPPEASWVHHLKQGWICSGQNITVLDTNTDLPENWRETDLRSFLPNQKEDLEGPDPDVLTSDCPTSEDGEDVLTSNITGRVVL